MLVQEGFLGLGKVIPEPLQIPDLLFFQRLEGEDLAGVLLNFPQCRFREVPSLLLLLYKCGEGLFVHESHQNRLLQPLWRNPSRTSTSTRPALLILSCGHTVVGMGDHGGESASVFLSFLPGQSQEGSPSLLFRDVPGVLLLFVRGTVLSHLLLPFFSEEGPFSLVPPLDRDGDHVLYVLEEKRELFLLTESLPLLLPLLAGTLHRSHHALKLLDGTKQPLFPRTEKGHVPLHPLEHLFHHELEGRKILERGPGNPELQLETLRGLKGRRDLVDDGLDGVHFVGVIFPPEALSETVENVQGPASGGRAQTRLEVQIFQNSVHVRKGLWAVLRNCLAVALELSL
mmetsp:Transcript_42877/g.110586  ORF Transcript_42877/g.110586 Transcript_42877/m.110586 type:complete len:343 (+) Transcript_42877:2150-3178(+)